MSSLPETQGSAAGAWRLFWRRHGIVSIALAALTANVLAYSQLATVDVLRQDQWRFLAVVRMLNAGTLGFDDLWSPAVAKRNLDRNFGYQLLFLANATWLGLDTDFERGTGVAVSLLLVLLLYSQYTSRAPPEAGPGLRQWTFLPIAFVVLSLLKWRAYAFSLTAFKLHWVLLLFALAFVWMDRLLIEGGRNPAAFLGFLALALLTFGGASMPAALAALAASVGVALVVPGQSRRHLAGLAGGLLATAAAVLSLYLHGLGRGSSPLAVRLRGLSEEPLEITKFFLIGLGRASAETWEIGGEVASIAAGIVVAALCVICLRIFWRQRMYRSSYLPVMLIVYALAYLLLVTLLRGDPDYPELAGQSRYLVNSSLAIVGCLWCLGWWFLRRPRWARGLARVAYLALAVWLVIAQVHSSLYRWEHISGVRTSYLRAERIVLESDPDDLRPEDYEVLGCRQPEWCIDGIETLRRQRLNVYRPDHAPSLR